MDQRMPQLEVVANDTDPDREIIIGDTGRDHFIRLDLEDDQARLKAGAALLNTFNFAIQEQAGRKHWTEGDFHRFIRAYVAIDGIGRSKP
jgi:hypothetical protein